MPVKMLFKKRKTLQSLNVVLFRPTIRRYDLSATRLYIQLCNLQYNVICTDSHVFTNKNTNLIRHAAPGISDVNQQIK